MGTTERAIVVTDVVGSSAAWERFGLAFAEALRSHDVIVRAALEAHEGVELLTEGDSFRVAFPDVSRALAFARDALLGLGSLQVNGYKNPLMIRIGVAAGPVSERADPRTGRLELLGPVVYEAVKVGWTAAPGQVLLSAGAAARAEAPLRDLGEHAVRGLEGPRRLWQLGDGDHGPLRATRSRPCNLPPAPDGVIGREAALEGVVEALLHDGALLTLHGPPGVGKSTLAHLAARQALDQLDGAWRIGLTATGEHGPLFTRVAQTLQLTLESDSDEAIAAALAGRGACLLWIDDAEEHTLDLRRHLPPWRAGAPRLRVLVTSRQPLGLPDERIFTLPPLDPDAALRLFLDQAPGLGDSPELRALLERLDHLPLAVTLAAARARSMSPRQMLHRLDQRFRLLGGPGKVGAARHASLRESLDASWEPLPPADQAALAALTAFAGDLDPHDAAQILGEEAPTRLQRLVDHGLLLRPSSGRLRCLHSVGLHAAERAPHARAAGERAHAAWFARRGAPGHPDAAVCLGGLRWEDELVSELPELLAAHRRAAVASDGATLAALARAAVILLTHTGAISDGLQLCGEAIQALDRLGAPGARPLRVARLYLRGRAGEGAQVLPELDALASITDEVEDAPAEALRHLTHAEALIAAGEPRAALDRLDDAERVSRSLPSPAAPAVPMLARGALLLRLGRPSEGLEVLDAARALVEPGPAETLRGRIDERRCLAWRILGDPERARLEYLRLLRGVDEGAERSHHRAALGNLGTLLARRGHLDEAAEHLARCARSAAASGERSIQALATANLAQVELDRGRPREAEALARAAIALERARGQPRSEVLAQAHVLIAATQVDSEERPQAADEAVHMLEGLGVARALCEALHLRAEQHLRRGAHDLAERDLQRADELLGTDPQLRAAGLALRARALLGRGEVDAARAALREARELARAMNAAPGAALWRLIEDSERILIS